MYLFTSVVIIFISLYYIGLMISMDGADTTFLFPLVVLFIYSLVSIIRETNKQTKDWFDDYHVNSYSTNYSNTSYRNRKRIKSKREAEEYNAVAKIIKGKRCEINITDD